MTGAITAIAPFPGPGIVLMPSVTCENLVKVFGHGKPVRALDGLTLSVEEGEIFGLLGPNGSGKTTFVKCCLNIIFPSSGRLRVLDRKPGSAWALRRIGYLPENPNFYDHLTGRAFLHYHSELARVPIVSRWKRINEVLDLVGLDKSATHRRLRTYSKGMLQRIGLAQALLAKPQLIFLDEPSTGLDPIGRRQVKDIMKEIASQGVTVLFSSHILADVEDVADRVAIIDRGQLKRIAPLNEITLPTNSVAIRFTSSEPVITVGDNPQIVADLRNKLERAGVLSVEYADGMLVCTVTSDESVPDIVEVLCTSGIKIYEVIRRRMSLEDTFLQEFGALPSGVISDRP